VQILRAWPADLRELRAENSRENFLFLVDAETAQLPEETSHKESLMFADTKFH